MALNETNLPQLFSAALEIASPEERDAFLDRKCGDNDQLREQVKELLAMQSRANGFLSTPPPELAMTACQVGYGGSSVLQVLEASCSIPHVALPESEIGSEPLIRPQSDQIPQTPSDSRYQLQGEIARGGMGAVLLGRDVDLGRRLAVKVLLDSHKEKPEIVERFIEEAQIGGQLQHPGIAPVYELGQFADKRPFFTMKLVEGKTLAEMLADRADSEDDLPRFFGIFEQVCQTIAYAHSRKVIHRDLKPSNIMVGSFGEVQVMDWGLGKVLHSGGIADESKAANKYKEISIIETVRSSSSNTLDDDLPVGSQTRAGSVMGTPAYMPPEQAQGESDTLDERADVFGLGAILCEILTGKPPYVADDGQQLLRKAIRGDLEDCHKRINDAAVDNDLKQLALDCLAADAEKRPRNADAVSHRITDYIESAAQRLRQAEVRRKLTYVVAASLLVVVAGLGAGAVWAQTKQTEVARQKTDAAEKVADVERERAEEQAAANDELQQLLYASEIQLASSELDMGNVQSAATILASHVPDNGNVDRRGFEWHYLDRLCLLPHQVGEVRDEWTNRNFRLGYGLATWSVDGSRVAKVSETEDLGTENRWTLTVWDADTEQIIWSRVVTRPSRRESEWGHFQISSDGRKGCFCATALPDRFPDEEDPEPNLLIEVFDFESETQHALETPGKYSAVNWSKWQFTPDGQRFVLKYRVRESGKVILSVWNLGQLKPLFSLEMGTKYPSNFAISPDGKTLLTPNSIEGDETNLARTGHSVVELRDMVSGEIVQSFSNPPDHRCAEVAFSPDGSSFATTLINHGASDYQTNNALWIRETRTGNLLSAAPTNSQRPKEIRFSPDGRMVCLAGSGELFDTLTGARVGKLAQMNSEDEYEVVYFGDDGKTIRGVALDGAIQEWNLPQLRTLSPMKTLGWFGTVASQGMLRVTLDEETASPYGTKKIHYRSTDGRSGTIELTDEKFFTITTGLALSGNGNILACSISEFGDIDGEETKSFVFLGLESGEFLGEPKGLQPDESVDHAVVAIPDSSLIVGSVIQRRAEDLPSSRIVGWSCNTQDEEFSIDLEPGVWVSALSASRDGNLFAAEIIKDATNDQRNNGEVTLRIFSTQDQTLLQSIDIPKLHSPRGPYQGPQKFQFSPDNNEIAGMDATRGLINIWDITTGQKRLSLDANTSQFQFTWTATGDRIVSFSQQRSSVGRGHFRVWETKSGKLLLSRGEHGGAAQGLKVLPDGRIIGWGDGLIPYIWDGTPRPANH